MSLPILSICIPTFNRCEFLQKCVESAVLQKEFTDQLVEIVVSDNASTDMTEKLCRKYAERYTNFVYIRNEKNIHDSNFPSVLCKANGVLRKLCNDTTIFENGSFSFLCELVQKYKERKPILFFQNGTDEEEILSTDLQGLCYKVSYNMTWIGSFSIWDTECTDLSVEKYTETKLWQTYQLMDRIASGKEVVLINKKLIRQQSLNKKDLSYGLYQVFCNNYLHLMREQTDQGRITEECFEWLEKDLLYNFFQNWMLQTQINRSAYIVSEAEDLFEMIEKHYCNKAYFEEFQKTYKLKLQSEMQKKEMFLTKLQEFSDKFEDVSIYGAGEIAQKYYAYFEDIGIRCKCFYVSEIQDNAEMISNIPIQIFDESAMKFFSDGKHGLVLGMGKKNTEEVYVKLKNIDKCIFKERI